MVAASPPASTSMLSTESGTPAATVHGGQPSSTIEVSISVPKIGSGGTNDDSLKQKETTKGTPEKGTSAMTMTDESLWQPQEADFVWCRFDKSKTQALGVILKTPSITMNKAEKGPAVYCDKDGPDRYSVAFVHSDAHVYPPRHYLVKFDLEKAVKLKCMRARLNSLTPWDKVKRRAIRDVILWKEGDHNFEHSHDFVQCRTCCKESTDEFWTAMGLERGQAHLRKGSKKRARGEGRKDNNDGAPSGQDGDHQDESDGDSESGRSSTSAESGSSSNGGSRSQKSSSGAGSRSSRSGAESSSDSGDDDEDNDDESESDDSEDEDSDVDRKDSDVEMEEEDESSAYDEHEFGVKGSVKSSGKGKQSLKRKRKGGRRRKMSTTSSSSSSSDGGPPPARKKGIVVKSSS